MNTLSLDEDSLEVVRKVIAHLNKIPRSDYQGVGEGIIRGKGFTGGGLEFVYGDGEVIDITWDEEFGYQLLVRVKPSD